MKNLKDLNVCLNQMPVIPGRPDLNTSYVIESISKAIKNKVDVLVFPEMCISGYLIGDLYEDESFVREIEVCNQRIIESVPAELTVIFGSLVFDETKKNEDGRWRKYNAAIIATAGKVVEIVTKTLQPNYRIFDDDRHLFSTRKVKEAERSLEDYFVLIKIETRIGEISIGVILCEDMWNNKGYNFNPTKVLVDKGADIIFNLSASPWTWRKNRKRHQVVKELLSESPVPFVYVNNTGTQNNGKNIIVFDGSSTVYNSEGDIIFAVTPYDKGNFEFIFPDLQTEIIPLVEEKFVSFEEKNIHDASELYAGWKCAVKGAFDLLPPTMRKVGIGLSGGIDSAVDVALLAHILGPENVYAINMPSHYNSEKTKNLAEQIATNLGVNYEIIPINGIVDAICLATGTAIDTLSYENIQARVRQEVLAARCQDLGGVFVCNSNKIEMAFNYGTLYGDIAGFIAPLGDMLKREVYQMGDYLNRIVYQREVIPVECFTIAPTAELKNAQKDPFHYGNLKTRGYHDELVRAFVEFRYNPEWVLKMYSENMLEEQFGLEHGTLDELFKTPADFLADLEKNYRSMFNSYFKRVQCPPIPILSRRAFGYDLRESMLRPFFTESYYRLKENVLASAKASRKIAIFGGSFNPPCKHHQEIARQLAKEFDLVIVVPCGSNRQDKDSVALVTDVNRTIMSRLAFKRIPKIKFDFYDLINDVYTPAYLLEDRYRKEYPEAEIWHVVGGDLVAGGAKGESEIQKIWKNGLEIWKNLNFCVVSRPGYDVTIADLPSKYKHISNNIWGSSTIIRDRLAKSLYVSQFLSINVLRFIKKHNLYGS